MNWIIAGLIPIVGCTVTKEGLWDGEKVKTKPKEEERVKEWGIEEYEVLGSSSRI